MNREDLSKLTITSSSSILRSAITCTKCLEFFMCEPVLPVRGEMREAMCLDLLPPEDPQSQGPAQTHCLLHWSFFLSALQVL